MVSMYLIIFLLFVHYIFDFIFQSDDIATQKSSNPWALLYHCILYGIGFVWFCCFWYNGHITFDN